MKHIINDLNPQSNDLAARINAVDTAFQSLRDAISGYTQTNEHVERKYGTESFLTGLMDIEAELTNIRNQVEAYRLSVAEKTDAEINYKMDHTGKYHLGDVNGPDLTK